MAALLFISLLCGCITRGYLPADKLTCARLSIPYRGTQLQSSTTLAVLNLAHDPGYQFTPAQVEEMLLTQSDTAVAFSGRSSDRLKTWLNLVVFDEYRLTATRKYFFLIDERLEAVPAGPGHVFIPPREGLLFDAEFVLDPEILTTPYATAEAQKVAILRWLADRFDRDVAALTGDPANPARGSKLIPLAAMMMNQTFAGLLTDLDKSPGLAQNLGTDRGIEFPHINLGKGRVRLLTRDDLAALTLRVNLPLDPLPQ
jgi:hypothetical protein